jgi:hypothetical protein
LTSARLFNLAKETVASAVGAGQPTFQFSMNEDAVVRIEIEAIIG